MAPDLLPPEQTSKPHDPKGGGNSRLNGACPHDAYGRRDGTMILSDSSEAARSAMSSPSLCAEDTIARCIALAMKRRGG
jgi:hypothetical protein